MRAARIFAARPTFASRCFSRRASRLARRSRMLTFGFDTLSVDLADEFVSSDGEFRMSGTSILF
jgi:hypothetical protein